MSDTAARRPPDPAAAAAGEAPAIAAGTTPAGSAADPTRVAAFFDLDKTLIASSSALAFRHPLLREGLLTRRAALGAAYTRLKFALTGADAARTERLRAQITALCTGWNPVEVRRVVAETLPEVIDPLIYPEAAGLITAHRAGGHDVVVLSATGAEVVQPIAEHLGADVIVATRMEVSGGRYSGVIEFYCYGEAKATAARGLAAARGYDLSRCYAYSDSSTDLPLLESVGRPCAVNPDRELRRVAERRGWPVCRFTRPRSARLLLPGAAFAVGLAALGAASASWFSSRRQRHAACSTGGTPATARLPKRAAPVTNY